MYIPFRIKRSEDRQYYFVIVAKNGQVLATSETYTRKENCKKSLVSAAFSIEKAWNSIDLLYQDETL